MQNRSNRNLLFGARATAGPDQAALSDAEALENDNQQSIENLRGSAGTMKDIALQVDASVNDQNRMLDKMVCPNFATFFSVPLCALSIHGVFSDRRGLS